MGVIGIGWLLFFEPVLTNAAFLRMDFMALFFFLCAVAAQEGTACGGAIRRFEIYDRYEPGAELIFDYYMPRGRNKPS